MALAAAQIVDAIVARLATTVAAGQVFTDRAWPLTKAQLPSWLVLPASEDISTESFDGIELHDLAIDCRGLVTAVADIDDAMHALAAAGLTAIHGAPYSNFTVRTAGITRGLADANGAEVGAITVRLQALFSTYASAPEVIL